MPRLNRYVLPGIPHHVTQRGNNRNTVFYRHGDYALYLDLLKRHARHNGVALLGYCLMPNHIHLVVTPQRAPALSAMMQNLQSSYARWIHTRLDRVGHCWQTRYYCAPLDEEHFRAAMVYVEQNPIRAHFVKSFSDWPWSSARAHIVNSDDGFLDLNLWRRQFPTGDWKSILDMGLANAAFLNRIREGTRKGLPIGSEDFLDLIEKEFQIQARAKPRGRPRSAVTHSSASA